jgi:hypothetical protein
VGNLSISEAEKVRARLREIISDEGGIIEAEIVVDTTLNPQVEPETSEFIPGAEVNAPRANRGKLTQLSIKFEEAGFGDREIIMGYCSKVVKRTITTRNDLTTAEANQILAQLAADSGR